MNKRLSKAKLAHSDTFVWRLTTSLISNGECEERGGAGEDEEAHLECVGVVVDDAVVGIDNAIDGSGMW